jgi:DNA-binding MarR family transcriptional regulator
MAVKQAPVRKSQVVRPSMITAMYRSIGHLVRRTHQLHNMVFAEETAECDVTAPQIAALHALEVFPDIDQTRLSAIIAYDRATIGGLVDRLEAKGYVRRSESYGDRRRKRLNLTAAGRTLLDDLRPNLTRVQRRILAPLSPEEQTTLLDLLERVIETEDAIVLDE